MRVLVLTSSWPLRPGDPGGGFVRDWCLDLSRRGMDLEVLAPRPAGDEAPAPDPDLPVSWLPALLPAGSRAFHGAGLETNLRRSPLLLAGLPPFLAAFAAEASLRCLRADRLVAHWLLPMGGVAAVLAALAERPLGIVAHSGPPAAARVPPLSRVLGAVARAASSVACVSDSVAREIRAVAGPRARLTTLPLGVDLRPAPEPPPAGARARHVVFVGRLVGLKGVDVLLRAAAGLPSVRLTVAGDGPEGPALRRLAADLGVEARFTGPLDREEARRAMAAADVVAVPSRTGWLGRAEGLPRVIPEAWSAGVPVVATSAGGCTEAIAARGGGLLARPGDAEDLRRALGAVLSDDGLRARLRREALAAAQDLCWDTVGDRWAAWVRALSVVPPGGNG